MLVAYMNYLMELGSVWKILFATYLKLFYNLRSK